MKIVVAEDDPSVRSLLVAELELAGHEVVDVVNGAAALTAVEQEQPDALVLDVMMPELTGWEVLQRLRASDRFCALPIVLVSARDVGDDVRHGYELGANAVLPKPFSGQALQDILTTLVPGSGPG
ncbi:MAG: response regulator [Actinobacteria bacterium]|nr:response regulator [Actinomycetota bacterium]MCA1720266.1 response regulator [Actinomycetota bacterium]